MSYVGRGPDYQSIRRQSESKAATGTEVLFDIPSWANRIIVLWDGVGPSANINGRCALVAGGVAQQNIYRGTHARLGGTTFASLLQATNGFYTYGPTSVTSASRISGIFILQKVPNTNVWCWNAQAGREEVEASDVGAGAATLPSELEGLSFILSAAGTFSAGTMTVICEG